MAGSEEEGQAYTATIFVFKTSAGIDSKNSHRFIGEVSSTGVALLKDWRACATALWFEALQGRCHCTTVLLKDRCHCTTAPRFAP